MLITKDKLIRAREISVELSQGINPFTGKPIADSEFIDDARTIRYFSFLSDVLTNNIEGKKFERPVKGKKFFILPEEVKNIVLPHGIITISVFVDAVNKVVDLESRKKLSATTINSQLKKMGILKTEVGADGKNQTRVTLQASRHGVIEEEIDGFERKYFRISYNEIGKQFLLDNLIDILQYSHEK